MQLSTALNTSRAKMRTCKSCLISKPLDQFYTNLSSKLGLDPLCKPCRCEYHRDRYHSQRDSNKRCISCKQHFPDSEFNKNTSLKDGLMSRCRTCQTLDEQERERRREEKSTTAEVRALREQIQASLPPGVVVNWSKTDLSQFKDNALSKNNPQSNPCQWKNT